MDDERNSNQIREPLLRNKERLRKIKAKALKNVEIIKFY